MELRWVARKKSRELTFTATSTGVSFDATKFGMLTPFVRDIDE